MRAWTRTLIYGNRSGYVIECVSCHKKDGMVEGFGRKKAQQLLPRMFKARGWHVGSSEKHDYCYACWLRKDGDER